jgi:diketogulonate reductase-like aldo/keto reductase
MMKEREAGRARVLGVSNVSMRHLEQMVGYHGEAPAFVQNRCFARSRWDREVRAFCRHHNITYQGFSLLTANPEVLQHQVIRGLAQKYKATVPQIVFRFSQLIGMRPLTGTSDPVHMSQDLESHSVPLSEGEVAAIESLVG